MHLHVDMFDKTDCTCDTKESHIVRKPIVINVDMQSKSGMVRCRICFAELKMYNQKFANNDRTYLSSSKHLTHDMTVADFCTEYLIRSHRKRKQDGKKK